MKPGRTLSSPTGITHPPVRKGWWEVMMPAWRIFYLLQPSSTTFKHLPNLNLFCICPVFALNFITHTAMTKTVGCGQWHNPATGKMGEYLFKWWGLLGREKAAKCDSPELLWFQASEAAGKYPEQCPVHDMPHLVQAMHKIKLCVATCWEDIIAFLDWSLSSLSYHILYPSFVSLLVTSKHIFQAATYLIRQGTLAWKLQAFDFLLLTNIFMSYS